MSAFGKWKKEKCLYAMRLNSNAPHTGQTILLLRKDSVKYFSQSKYGSGVGGLDWKKNVTSVRFQ